jgi:plastocyanin
VNSRPPDTARAGATARPIAARPGAAALLACAALLAAGCGSSGSGGSSTSANETTSSSAAATSTGTQTSSPSYSSGPKADTTPKYASPSPSEPAKSGTIQIAYRNLAIDPDTVRAKVGATIRWTNEDSQKCNVTSEGGGPYKFSSGDIPESGTFELKLDRPGTIHYECTYFPVTMNGTIEVVG